MLVLSHLKNLKTLPQHSGMWEAGEAAVISHFSYSSIWLPTATDCSSEIPVQPYLMDRPWLQRSDRVTFLVSTFALSFVCFETRMPRQTGAELLHPSPVSPPGSPCFWGTRAENVLSKLTSILNQRSLRWNKILHRVLFEKAVLVLCHWSETVGRASLQILFWSCLKTCCLNSVSWRTPILNKSSRPKQMEPKLKFHCDRPPELASANLHISEATEGNLKL